MAISFLLTALLAVSLATNLTVEGIKNLLDGSEIKYSSNVLAAVVAVLLSGLISAAYILYFAVPLTVKMGVEIAVLMYLSFLVSTVGYDKVVQMITQIRSKKEE